MREARMAAHTETDEMDGLKISADAERNFLNQGFPKTVLQAVENFFAPIADDF